MAQGTDSTPSKVTTTGKHPLAGRFMLAVVLLIGLTALAVWLNPAKAVRKGQDLQRRQDLQRIQLALKEYAAEHQGQYPQAQSQAGYYSCFNCGWKEASVDKKTGQSFNRNNWIPDLVEQGYMSALPIDPMSGRMSGCPVSGYIYLSGGVGYKLFAWCTPTTELNLSASQDAYCRQRPPYDGEHLTTKPDDAPALKPFVDPVRPQWGYAIYTRELACY